MRESSLWNGIITSNMAVKMNQTKEVQTQWRSQSAQHPIAKQQTEFEFETPYQKLQDNWSHCAFREKTIIHVRATVKCRSSHSFQSSYELLTATIL